MSITSEGIEAERKAREFLNSKNIYDLQQIDWLIKINNKYYIVEVKCRELYKPPPYWGTGLDIKQLNKRIQIFFDLGIDTILLVFEKGTENIYYQYITKLIKSKYFDTKNSIRIFDINEFIKTSI